MATHAEIIGYISTLDCFTATDEEDRTFFLDFSDVEKWYKIAVARRETEEKKFEQELKAQRNATPNQAPQGMPWGECSL